VAYYREVGFLPEGLLNALVRFGWSLDDQTENMSLLHIVENFSLDRVVKGAAAFDPDQLMSFQSHWMGQLPESDKVAGCLAFLIRAGLIPEGESPESINMVQRVVELAGDRIRVFGDILELSEFFVTTDGIDYDTDAFRKRVVTAPEAVGTLRQLTIVLTECQPFSAESLPDSVTAFVADQDLKFGQVAPVLRLAITGKNKGADLFPTLELIGRDECLRRMQAALAAVELDGTT